MTERTSGNQEQSDKKLPGGASKNVLSDFGPFLTLGLQLAISVVAFFFIGYWLDSKLGTSPWCTIGGAFLGAAGGLIKFLKEAMALGKQADADLKQTKGEKPHHEDAKDSKFS